MIFHVVIHADSGDCSAFFEGMARPTVVALLEEKGSPYDFVTPQDYKIFNDATDAPRRNAARKS